MERLQFVVREINKLLGTNYNLLSFDALGSAKLLQIVCNVLQAVDACPKMTTLNQDPSQIAIIVLNSLQSIKYLPPDTSNVGAFCDSVAMGDTNIIYPILEWLLKNQNKIKKRAYLARYADKLPIPLEASEDPDVMQTYKSYEKMIEEFWFVYKENNAAKKDCMEATELQNDIKKMNNDLKNLTQRSQVQWEKLSNVPNKENLVYMGKSYRGVCTEQRNLTEQIKKNLELTTKLEFQVKNLEDKWSRRGRQPLVDTNIFEMVREEARVNKIFFETQLPQEFEDQKNLVTVMEKTMEPTCPPREYLHKSVDKLKDDVQRLMNEKLTLYANTEDKLGPFRKQASTIAQRKLEMSNELKDIKDGIMKMDENIREKEITLFNVVGGEILHGEELKHFIATLREKSIVYKQLRAQLQGVSTELGIENRTLDVLKNIDPTIDSAFFNANIVSKEEQQSEYSNSITEAKQICKQFMQEVDILKSAISQVHGQLISSKKDSDMIKHTLEEVKYIFENATRTVLGEVQQIKEKIRESLNDIDLLENTWKTTTQSLDKTEYIFNRLIDEMLTDTAEVAAGNETSYLGMLMKQKEETQKRLEEAQNNMRKFEEVKKQEQETIEFLKHTEYLILKKLEEENPE